MNHPWMISIVAAIAGLMASTSMVSAQWHTAVGGNSRRDGFIDVDGPGRTRPRALWSQTLSVEFPSSVSCPIIAEGKLFIDRDFNLNDVDNGSSITAHKVRTGEVLWRMSIPPEISVNPNPNLRGPNNVIGYNNGTLYATRAGSGSRVSRLYGIDPATGAIRWQSPEAVFTANSKVDSPAFLPNGDLILAGRVPWVDGIGTTAGLLRVNGLTGEVRWRTSVETYNSYGDGTMSWAVHGNRAYGWDRVQGGTTNFWISSYDLDTGLRVHSAPVPGYVWSSFNAHQQASLMVGPDGTVYVNRLGVALVALRETPTGFVQLWQRPMGGYAFHTNAIGPDGSLYISLTDPLNPAVQRPAPNYIVRVDPATGAEISRSPARSVEDVALRLAVDRNGIVYGTNMGTQSFAGWIFAFTPDLQEELWAVPAYGTYTGGIALAEGVLVAACTGPIIRVIVEECIGDFDDNDTLTVQDIFSFLAAWFAAEDDSADVNLDDEFTVQDIFTFLESWFEGC